MENDGNYPWAVAGSHQNKDGKEEGADEQQGLDSRKSYAAVRSCGIFAGNRAEGVGVRGCGSLPQHPPVPAMRPSFSVLLGTSF